MAVTRESKKNDMPEKYEIIVTQGDKVVYKGRHDYFDFQEECGRSESDCHNGQYRGDMRFATGKSYSGFETSAPLSHRLSRCEFCDGVFHGDREARIRARLEMIDRMKAMHHRYKLAAQATYPWMRLRTWRFWKPWRNVLLCAARLFSCLGKHDVLLRITAHIYKYPSIIYTTASFFKNNNAWPSLNECASTEEILKTNF